MSSSHKGSFVHKTKLTATFLGVSVVAGALTAGLALPAIGGVGLGAKSAVGDFNSLPDDFTAPRCRRPPRSTTRTAA